MPKSFEGKNIFIFPYSRRFEINRTVKCFTDFLAHIYPLRPEYNMFHYLKLFNLFQI